MDEVDKFSRLKKQVLETLKLESKDKLIVELALLQAWDLAIQSKFKEYNRRMKKAMRNRRNFISGKEDGIDD